MSKKKSKNKPKPKVMTPAEQRESMIKRFGTDCLWVDVTLHLTYQEMLDTFGPECDDYEPLCICCSEWKSWHKTGTATISFEREELLELNKVK
jgi:hypothetical protein